MNRRNFLKLVVASVASVAITARLATSPPRVADFVACNEAVVSYGNSFAEWQAVKDRHMAKNGWKVDEKAYRRRYS